MKRLIVMLSILLSMIAVPSAVLAQDVLFPNCTSTSPETVCQDAAPQQTPDMNTIYGPNGILTKVARVISIAVGIASVIVIILAGFQYILANGDSGKISRARDTIIYALIGVTVAVMAQVIIQFVIVRL